MKRRRLRPSPRRLPSQLPPSRVASSSAMASSEPLLRENPGRFVLFPIQHTKVSPSPLASLAPSIGTEPETACASPPRAAPLPAEPRRPPLCLRSPPRLLSTQVWDMYKKAEASFWTAEEVDLAHDHKVRRANGRPLSSTRAPAATRAASKRDAKSRGRPVMGARLQALPARPLSPA